MKYIAIKKSECECFKLPPLKKEYPNSQILFCSYQGEPYILDCAGPAMEYFNEMGSEWFFEGYEDGVWFWEGRLEVDTFPTDYGYEYDIVLSNEPEKIFCFPTLRSSDEYYEFKECPIHKKEIK